MAKQCLSCTLLLYPRILVTPAMEGKCLFSEKQKLGPRPLLMQQLFVPYELRLENARHYMPKQVNNPIAARLVVKHVRLVD